MGTNETLVKIAELLDVEIESITENSLQELYDEALNEMGDVKIGDMAYTIDRVLKEVDPVAYRCGFVDWLDFEGWNEIDAGFLDAEGLGALRDRLKNAIDELEL